MDDDTGAGDVADFTGQDLTDGNLKGAKLDGAIFVDAHMKGLNLKEASFNNADFSSSFLHDADFRGADVRNANFTEADLTDADFRGAKLDGAIFDGALTVGTLFGEDPDAMHDDDEDDALQSVRIAVVERLNEIKEEIKILVDEAEEQIRDAEEPMALKRARSYWIPHILGALDKDNKWMGGSMTRMEDTINDLREG